MSRKMQAVDTGEQQKIMKLKAESSAKDKDHKVEWMYSGDKIDRDAYLLGKPIDKLLIEKEIDKPKLDVFANTVDLANKIREDPLFEIKKKEIEAKKRLLENPHRLKQLQEQIKPARNNYSESDDSDSEYRRKKNKKGYQHQQQRDQRQRYDHRESDKYRSRENDQYERRGRDDEDRSHRKRHNKASRNRSSDSSGSEDYEKGKKKYDRRNRDEEDSRRKHDKKKASRKRSSDSSSGEDYKKSKKKSSQRERSRSRSRSRTEQRHPDRPGYGLIERRDNEEYKRQREGPKSDKQLEIEEIKRKIERLKQIRGNEDSKKSATAYNRNAPKPKMTEEEKQRRLAEMQDNAKWREDLRSSNLKKYKDEEVTEKRQHAESTSESSQAKASQMFNHMMHDAYSSAADRIHRNRKNLQRGDTEKSFTKR